MTKLNVRGYISTPEYTRLFGQITPAAPFGHNIWHGMRELLHSWQRDGGRPSYYPRSQLRLGWFNAPSPFSRHQASQDISTDVGRNWQYPAIFYIGEVEFQVGYTMWCEAILIMRSRSWLVHPSRVQLIPEYEEWLL